MQTKPKCAFPISGDQQFFLRFYEEYKTFLYYIAGQYTASSAERDDLTQEALVRLLQHTDTLRQMGPAETATYIALTVRSAFLDMQRRLGHEVLVEPYGDMLDILLSRQSLGAPDPDARLAVQRLRSGLSRRDWLVLEGKYILGYTHEELSALLGVDRQTMRSVVSRAKKRAREILNKKKGDV